MFGNQSFSEFASRQQQQQQQQKPQQPQQPPRNARLRLQQLRRSRPSLQRMPSNSPTSLVLPGPPIQAWQGGGFGHGMASGPRPANPMHMMSNNAALSDVPEETEDSLQQGSLSMRIGRDRTLDDIYNKLEQVYAMFETTLAKHDDGLRSMTQVHNAFSELSTMVQNLYMAFQQQKKDLEAWAAKLEALFLEMTPDPDLRGQQPPPQEPQQQEQHVDPSTMYFE